MSQLSDKLARGEFVVTAEIPSVNTDRRAVERAVELYAPFVDAINATDNPAAHAHASPLAVAIAIREAGVEPIMQLVCRDRNRIALEAEIVGGALHGIENLCCLTGDDVTAGDEPEARRVFDVDSSQLVGIARTLASGRYLSGRVLEPAPKLFIGAVENPYAPPHAYRVQRAAKKAAVGARFLQLQIGYDLAPLRAFMAEAVRSGLHQKVALIPSVCIPRSARGLRFIEEHVPGVTVPAELIERVAAAADGAQACEDLAYELAAEMVGLPGVAGLHVISFGRDGAALRLCERLGNPSRTGKHGKEDVGHGSAVQV
jgi:methylenetetrahydrofolate reductase (NADPH)